MKRTCLGARNSTPATPSFLLTFIVSKKSGGDFLSENRASGWHYVLFSRHPTTVLNRSFPEADFPVVIRRAEFNVVPAVFLGVSYSQGRGAHGQK